MRSSASRSDGYCSPGSSPGRLACGAERSCRGSDGSVAREDTAAAAASRPPETPGVSCVCGYSRRVSCDEHRRRPANGERHAGVDTSRATASAGRCVTSLRPTEAVSPEGQTRRRISSGRWRQACLHICESVFFRLKLWVVAFFPRFRASEPHFFVFKYGTQLLHADRFDGLLFDDILVELLQRPACKGQAQKFRRTFLR